MALPPPTEPTPVPRVLRPIALAAVMGGGVCLFAAIAGLILIGSRGNEAPAAQDAITALSTVAGSLAGAFGGWLARSGSAGTRHDDG